MDGEEKTWVELGTYGGYIIQGFQDKRRLVDKKTGMTIGEYTI